ncbi:hypothetical protein NPIL_637611 [Nephila pilipes]|uniref:Uncharacterized protein n=1 Tax=Nephila pilipes TaxID=299642 RepID=A0A8X6U3U5_NEPPI|nr:hypothetical protein NPIL_637611 [Nephila pilipes]
MLNIEVTTNRLHCREVTEFEVEADEEGRKVITGRHRTPSIDVQVSEISQRNPCPHHDTSTSECLKFVDVLGLTSYTLFTPDSYMIVI